MSEALRYETVLDQIRDTRHIEFSRGALRRVGKLSGSYFPGCRFRIVADLNTWEVAGKEVSSELKGAGLECLPEHVFHDSRLKAEEKHVEALKPLFGESDIIPVAVGSGTINDLVKLAAHETGRRYISVATAASMDGYTSYGASITISGIKQTKSCPAPFILVADQEILERAPARMNASGYADLLAKINAGADWLLAEFMQVESIHRGSWDLIQLPLRQWLAEPEGVYNRDPVVLANLMDGLIWCGLAMQLASNSRPASGAEHQFSHLWDMESHRHGGQPVPHGIQVGIGSIATGALYEKVLSMDFSSIDCGELIRRRPEIDHVVQVARDVHEKVHIAESAAKVIRKKYPDEESYRQRLQRIKENGSEIVQRLESQLSVAVELSRKLRISGAACSHESIGIDKERLEKSYFKAYTIRDRYTILDFAFDIGQLPGVPGELWKGTLYEENRES